MLILVRLIGIPAGEKRMTGARGAKKREKERETAKGRGAASERQGYFTLARYHHVLHSFV